MQAKGNAIRIMSGLWRGKKIKLSNDENLRPTPSRVRETLFNWVAPFIQGAKCLDLFAGSGILSFEALSRGAKSVFLLEKNVHSFQMLLNNKENLKLTNLQQLNLINQDALKWLKMETSQSFDLVFIDPPYNTHLCQKTIELLINHHWLKSKSLIYFEHNEPILAHSLPSSINIVKHKKAGQVYYYLAQYQDGQAENT
ncbi:MAG: rRNA ((966)-N(2))-methyltransferase RsmD [Francisellaceae bacterium]|nr:rRNA ((966)-N(2))-methyltransferase RsmD [Francisellaceae bacterium]